MRPSRHSDSLHGLSTQEIRRWRLPPEIAEVGQNVAIPGLWSLRRVMMPRTGIEIAEVFILHLVQLDLELDNLVIEIAMIDCNVVTWPMAHGSPVDRHPT